MMETLTMLYFSLVRKIIIKFLTVAFLYFPPANGNCDVRDIDVCVYVLLIIHAMSNG